ncbi:MAG: phenol hydroxylase subunit P4 [Alphaproteobacteria bacterium]|nr:phenol hydroxylase subunit P4 [Alphaproteobacteria bacterium]
MALKAITPDYESHTENRDLPELYHGNLMIYVHWEEHLSFVAAIALPLPPQTPFGAIREAIAAVYGPHPDWDRIDWSKVIWKIDGRSVNPDPEKSIADHGMHHKSLLRFWTPGLEGYQGTRN